VTDPSPPTPLADRMADDSAMVGGGVGGGVGGAVGVVSRDNSAMGRGRRLTVGLGVGLVGTLALGALGLTLGRHGVEQNLAVRTQGRLAAAKAIGVSISYSGRDATLRVPARMDAARVGQVVARTAGIQGVRVVHVVRVNDVGARASRPASAPKTPPARIATTSRTTPVVVSSTQALTPAPAGLRASLRGDVVELSGFIPYEAIRPTLIATVSGAKSVLEVRDLLEIDPVSSSDPSLLPGVASMMVALRNEGVATGTATLANDTLTVEGRVTTVAAHDRLLAWAVKVMGSAIRVVDYLSVGS